MADNPNQDVQAREAAVVQNPDQEAPQPHGQRRPAQDNPDGPPRQRARPNPRQPQPHRQVEIQNANPPGDGIITTLAAHLSSPYPVTPTLYVRINTVDCNEFFASIHEAIAMYPDSRIAIGV
ncbi:unnamed protein product [Bemisia tabaci]|uniref:Uncharacterized protein n=1 Tax=Bemisia tabaci TaxID=7038 RepID=A0A9P0A0L5_BEMTA|nr:unnamed protein product [Bemisia tabaci]